MSSSLPRRRRNPLLNKLMSREGRKWLYGIALTVVPLLVAYGVVTEEAAPLWIALLGSFLAPTLALTHLSPVESGDVPEEL
jgi:hypothetical protein